MAALADWRVFLAVIGLFIVVFAIWRMVSLGSVIAAGTYPIATFFRYLFYRLLSWWNCVLKICADCYCNYCIDGRHCYF